MNQILADQIQAGSEKLWSENHKHTNSICSKANCLISGMSLLLYQFTKMAIKLTLVIIVGYHCYQLHTTLYPIFFSQV
jgi:hypothetical protein